MKKQKTRVVTIITLIISVLVFFSLNSPITMAQDEEIVRLRQQVADLEKRIKDLENLLRITKNPEGINETEGQGWQNKKNWRDLKVGMTPKEVYRILGEPIKTIEGVKTFWYYPNIYCGYVSFDEDGSLIKWSEP